MPTFNRLRLDFSLEYIDERIDFIKNYVNNDMFKKNPITDTEAETISNYVLWGKSRIDGKNGV